MSEMRGLLHDNIGDNVVELRAKKVFSYREMCQLLPVIIRITKSYSEKVDVLLLKLDALAQRNASLIETEAEINSLLSEWQGKVERLGAHTKGLWIADFDSGDGYFCWKYPEAEILYWHGYRDGFSGRRPVKEYLERKSKDSNENLHSSNQSHHKSL